MTQKELLERMDGNEIMEWWAYDLLKDEKFLEKLRMQDQSNMSDEERMALLKAAFTSAGS